jgi:DNA-binding NtrC family response regulator
MAVLQDYPWPGNVRELRNVLERAAILSKGSEICPADLYLPQQIRSAEPVASIVTEPSSASLSQLRDLERKMIMDAMARNADNKTAAARELRIPLSTLKRRLKDYTQD